ncbi:MAG: hypothetical protein FalmKO_17720 [Falsiruegeria mediterranea]
MPRHRPPKRIRFNHINADACQRMWAAVLQLAIKEAKTRPEARRWLFGREAEHVAALTGLDPDAYRANIARLLDSDDHA